MGKHAAVAMEGDTEHSKVHYFYHWIGEGSSIIDDWKRKGTLIPQADFEKLTEEEKKAKYSQDKLESYFTLFESLLASRSNPLFAVKDLYFLKKNSMTAGEFHSLIHKTAKRCKFPNAEAEERATRDTLYLGMKSQKVRDKCINLMNDGDELTIDFIMKHLEVEDSNPITNLSARWIPQSVLVLCQITIRKARARDIRNIVEMENHQHRDHKMDKGHRIPHISQEFHLIWKESA